MTTLGLKVEHLVAATMAAVIVATTGRDLWARGLIPARIASSDNALPPTRERKYEQL
ncbi:MAG: hypothetical protein ACRBK7_08900 [Acidimicrobiales bacterium]